MIRSATPSSNSTITQPTDSISCIYWTSSLRNNQFLAASWDCSLRVYEYHRDSPVNLQYTTLIETPDPFLALADPDDISSTFGGSITGSIYMFDINRGQMTEIGIHSDAVKDLHYLPHSKMLVSASYDTTLRFWDPRTFEEIGKITFPEKIYCSDFNIIQNRIALGLSNEHIFFADLNEISRRFGQFVPQLTMSPLGKGSQLTAISLSNNDSMLALATADGRASISRISNPSEGENLKTLVTFKAHKLDPGQGGNTSNLKILYPVHAIGFHPTLEHKLFTAGGDGKIHYWDYQTKDKISSTDLGDIPMTKAAFSRDGRLIAFGRGYDWSNGIQGDQSYPSYVGARELRPMDFFPQ